MKIKNPGLIYLTFLVIFSLAGVTTGYSDQGLLEKGKKVLEGLGQSTSDKGLSNSTIDSGLREALKKGTADVVNRLGQPGGFLDNPKIHIPLPDSFNKVQSALGKVGAGSMLDDLEVKLNRAAEKATPKAKDLFWKSITEMTFDDVRSIYKGPEDAATRYFQDKMSEPLAKEMKPVVEETLSQVGAIKRYDNIMEKYTSLPFVPDVKSDLVSHTLDQTLEGLFNVLAKEEAAIRQNPAKQSTELLKKLFGQN